MLDIQLPEAKIFYDQNGQAEETLTSYDSFRRIEALLEQFDILHLLAWCAIRDTRRLIR